MITDERIIRLVIGAIKSKDKDVITFILQLVPEYLVQEFDFIRIIKNANPDKMDAAIEESISDIEFWEKKGEL